jgi:transcriptional regulator with XRE-family HTH domain
MSEKTFYDKVAKEARTYLDLSVEYTASLLEITTDELIDIENGIISPSEKVVEMMAKVYGVSIQSFYQPLKKLTSIEHFQVFKREISNQVLGANDNNSD